jgi:ABC-type transport system involved in cytochrome c biogenesis permease component
MTMTRGRRRVLAWAVVVVWLAGAAVLAHFLLDESWESVVTLAVTLLIGQIALAAVPSRLQRPGRR